MTQQLVTRSAALPTRKVVRLVGMALWAMAAILVAYDLVQVVELSRAAWGQMVTQRKLAECLEIERTETKREHPPEYLAPEGARTRGP